MINEFDSAVRMTHGLLVAYDHVTEANINEAIDYIRLLKLSGALSSVDLTLLKERLMEMFHATFSYVYNTVT